MLQDLLEKQKAQSVMILVDYQGIGVNGKLH